MPGPDEAEADVSPNHAQGSKIKLVLRFQSNSSLLHFYKSCFGHTWAVKIRVYPCRNPLTEESYLR